jgi:hypothetical protein
MAIPRAAKQMSESLPSSAMSPIQDTAKEISTPIKKHSHSLSLRRGD